MRLPTFYEQNLIPNWGIPSQVQSMEEGHREPPIGLSCPTHQETSGANRGQVACILERKTSSCYGFNYVKVRFFC